MRVAIIGLGPGWEEAPYDCETWGINQLICRRPVSKVIDIHIITQFDNEHEMKYLVDARKKAEEDGTPIIEIENYPLHEIIKEFETDYFANSVAYAIALAIYKGYDEIDLYGINQSTGKEYIFEKCRGIKVVCEKALRGISTVERKRKEGTLRTESLYELECHH